MEIDYEKAYNEALERARQIKDGKDEWRYSDLAEITPALAEIFPELAETEDEKIRKAIVECVEKYGPAGANPPLFRDMLDWLEKQKEQNPKMTPRWLYRLEFKDSSCGLWYDGTGKWCFESGIGSIADCKTKNLPMDYDERYKQEGRDWFSSCSCKEDLMHWYSLEDAKELISKGFVFTRYLATEYHEYDQQTVFIKETSLYREEIDIFELFKKKPAEWSERYIADVFEKVGLAKIAREQGNDKLTNALQDAMLELSKAESAEWSDSDKNMLRRIYERYMVLSESVLHWRDVSEETKKEEYVKLIDEMLFVETLIERQKPGTTPDNPIDPFDTKLFQDGVKEGRRLEREDMKQKWGDRDRINYEVIRNHVESDGWATAEQIDLYRSLSPNMSAEWSEDWREEDIQTRFAFYTYKDDPSVLYLSNVFVEETSRNHGFGTRILKAAEKVAETIGATTISLKVKLDSPANAWYRKHGYGYVSSEDGYDWLEKNIENRKSNKQDWSEEDEEMVQFFLDDYNGVLGKWTTQKILTMRLKFRDWLRNKVQYIRPQPHWKPSEEQMRQLGYVAEQNKQNMLGKELVTLYEDLKKLM